MADNTLLNAGTGGDTIATDDVGAGVKVQRVKVGIGIDGAYADVNTATPLPISDAGGSLTVDGAVSLAAAIPAGLNNIGDVDVLTAPGTAADGAVGLPAVAYMIAGYDGTNVQAIVTDSTGRPTVNINGTVPVSGPLTDAQLRATAVPISGTVTASGPLTDAQLRATAVPTSLATAPALVTGTATIGKVGLDPQTAGGLSTFHLVSAATTNATNVKASAGQLFGWYIYNSNAAARKVAFHNTAGTPTAGAAVVSAIVIPPTSAANVEFTNGVAFATGIAITTVTDLADAGATAVAASDLVINLYFK